MSIMWYRKINIKLLEILFLFFLKLYLVKLVVFVRASYFWMKRTVILAFNFYFHNCQKFVP